MFSSSFIVGWFVGCGEKQTWWSSWERENPWTGERGCVPQQRERSSWPAKTGRLSLPSCSLRSQTIRKSHSKQELLPGLVPPSWGGEGFSCAHGRRSSCRAFFHPVFFFFECQGRLRLLLSVHVQLQLEPWRVGLLLRGILQPSEWVNHVLCFNLVLDNSSFSSELYWRSWSRLIDLDSLFQEIPVCDF
jgi:hypothetical protein